MLNAQTQIYFLELGVSPHFCRSWAELYLSKTVIKPDMAVHQDPGLKFGINNHVSILGKPRCDSGIVDYQSSRGR